MNRIILASTSKYRKALLEQLGLEFEVKAPNVNEEAFKNLGLSPVELAETLAKLKAESLKASGVCVIGGDQVVALDNEIFGKAGSIDKAISQLLKMQNRTHEIITSICVCEDGHSTMITNRTKMKMRELTEAEIKKYIELDQPLDCAGSYKIEKHGISLFEKIDSEDWSSIQGLPLLALNKYFIEKGYK